MQQVFWGIVFLFLNVNLTFGSVTIGLFPDFVGYLLLLQGARTLAGRGFPGWSRCASAGRPIRACSTS